MLIKKYKGLMLAITGCIIGVFSVFYLQDLAYPYKLGIKIFAALLVMIGWTIISESDHFYKKKRDNDV